MKQQTELHPAATPCSQQTGTGPAAAQAITVQGVDPAQHPDSTAVLQFVIRPDEIIVTALLVMGTIRKVEQRWQRRTRNSWALAGGPPLFDFEKAAVSPDVADFLDRAGVPITVANMLPRRPTGAAGEAIAAAAQEVAGTGEKRQ